MTTRELRSIFRGAARRVDKYSSPLSGSCLAIVDELEVRGIRDYDECYRVKSVFGRVFCPTAGELRRYRHDDAWWLAESVVLEWTPSYRRANHVEYLAAIQRARQTRVLALLFAAEMARTGDLTT